MVGMGVTVGRPGMLFKQPAPDRRIISDGDELTLRVLAPFAFPKEDAPRAEPHRERTDVPDGN